MTDENIRARVNAAWNAKRQQERATAALSERRMSNEEYSAEMRKCEQDFEAAMIDLAIGVLTDVNRIANALEIIAGNRKPLIDLPSASQGGLSANFTDESQKGS